MRGIGRAAAGVALAASLAAGASPGWAQSITSVRGLGYPLLPVDARSAALGGLGVGLHGFAAPMVNPASAAGVSRRGFVLALETTNRDMSLGDASESTSATRFPLLQMIFPMRSVVLTLGYGGYLDQSWGVQSSGAMDLGTGGSLPYEDVVQSTGGVGQFQLGAAVPLGEDIAIGASVGALTGNQRVQLVRQFDTAGTAGFDPFVEEYGWRYSGVTAAFGAEAELGALGRVGASVRWSGDVTADSTAGPAAGRTLDLPLEVAAGGSVYLGPRLLLAASGRWSGWGDAAPAGAGGGVARIGEVLGARDTWEFGAGLELDDTESRAPRSYPIRIGFQYRQLPFTFVADQPTELFYGAGIGMRMGTDPENPVGLVDFAVQYGTRSAAGDEDTGDFSERVWRFALTLSLFGN